MFYGTSALTDRVTVPVLLHLTPNLREINAAQASAVHREDIREKIVCVFD